MNSYTEDQISSALRRIRMDGCEYRLFEVLESLDKFDTPEPEKSFVEKFEDIFRDANGRLDGRMYLSAQLIEEMVDRKIEESDVQNKARYDDLRARIDNAAFMTKRWVP